MSKRKCKRCKKSFSDGTRRQYCPTCWPINRKEILERAHRKETYKRGGIPYVGKGGAQWRDDNHQWKGGVRAYRDMTFFEEGEGCSRCGSKKNVVAHHIDNDRYNNKPENLVPLCSACHGDIHVIMDVAFELEDELPKFNADDLFETKEWEQLLKGEIDLKDLVK